ncbi:MAG: metallophosphoesterase family protein [Promethearchaeia archaeon]
MIKIIHVADTHLGFRLRSDFRKEWYKFGEIRWYENEFYEKWNEFLDFCIDKQDSIDFIVHAGDLFHNPFPGNPYPPPEPARRVVVEGLKRFFKDTENKIPFILIDGNHGVFQGYRYTLMDSITAIFPNVYYFSVWDLRKAISEKKPLICEFSDKNTRFYLFPYFDFMTLKDYEILYNEWIEQQRPKGDAIEIAVAHCSTLDQTQHVKLGTFNYSYVALGHEHNQRKLTNRMFFSGSFVPMHFNEVDFTNGFLEVSIEKGKEPIIKEHIFENERDFKIIEIEVNPSSTSSSVLNDLIRELEPYKTGTWNGKTAARLKINFIGNVPLKNFWELNEQLTSVRSKILNQDSYNLLQLKLTWNEVSKDIEDDLKPEIIKEYILSDPKSEFLDYIKSKIKPEEGYDLELLAEIAVDVLEKALKKSGG